MLTLSLARTQQANSKHSQRQLAPYIQLHGRRSRRLAALATDVKTPQPTPKAHCKHWVTSNCDRYTPESCPLLR